MILMPEKQFSDHDKPGGKVIKKPHRDEKPSRHHSRTKAKEVSHTDGEHEDDHFGAFDGHTVDLRGLLREALILEMPMKTLCIPDGKAVRLDGDSQSCQKIKELMEKAEKSASTASPFAKALETKIKK